jgi:SAM-dependent methyltransferase
MGAKKFRQAFVSKYMPRIEGMKILDIGCGPADILEYLPNSEYWGFDVSNAYIDQAKRLYGNRGRFFCKQLDFSDLEVLPKFDYVMALGLLHHLDNGSASVVLQLAGEALKPGGSFISFDPCFDSSQNIVARFLISNDRGQHVRTKEKYLSLVEKYFASTSIEVSNRKWIPYTHCFMECKK